MKSYVIWNITLIVRWKPTFRRNVSPLSSGLKNKSSEKPAWTGQQTTRTFQSCIEVTCSSQTSVDIQRTTRHYDPEDGIIHIPNITILRLLSDSAVGIAADYGLDDRRVGVWVSVGSRIFSSQRPPERLWGPPNPLYDGYGRFFPRGKAAKALS
jgi:hypothetical protein